MRESMRSIITSTFGIKDELNSNELKKLFEHGSPFSRMAHKPEMETLQVLEFQRTFLKKRVEILNHKLQKIEDKISKLEDKNRNEDVS